MTYIFKYWLNALPLSIGVLLTVASIYFMNGLIHGINFSYPDIYFENTMYLIATLACGLTGIPLSVYGIEKIEKKNI